MVTVIIPALNEANTIVSVIRFCQSEPLVSEIIVVDDTSDDNTVELAREAGARVLISATRGKGISMKEGIDATTNDMVVFLDADIDPYPDQSIHKLVSPLINDEADFVKGSFARNAGRVTELVAKPLLTILFPGLAHFAQPLSGMIAGKKNYFQKIEFFNDYGVDIGILIDMYLMKARVAEVNIGYIENKSKPWEALGKMSREVSRAILSRAQRHNSNEFSLESVNSLETIQREMNNALRENLSAYHKMIVLDMDDTILTDRFINVCAAEFGFSSKLDELRFNEKDPIILTKRIGLLLKNRTMDELLHVISNMQMAENIREMVKVYKEKGYLVGIISHSYTLITNYVKQQIGADFSVAHQLEFFEGKATGEVNLPSYFFGSPESICGHSFCKTNALQHVCEQYNVKLKNVIAVGDSKDDRCMIAHAGKGIAFCATDEMLEKIAFKSIKQRNFEPLLALA
ncbi:MAG: HAD-IB family phosphatase [Sphingobacteriales bacterium]|jgi:HAD superfamily phosphoserine phosphatase-like hydrolase|nr:HAD-IB family phosphatase [Sphingobacteriales bacterium]NCT75699.1 HAD-IB family phosphatase [Chitinophagaceae bacterium]OJW30803.1 MAG: glycosyl transferase family 2 [Sphingobacteriales bacterium 46-32]